MTDSISPLLLLSIVPVYILNFSLPVKHFSQKTPCAKQYRLRGAPTSGDTSLNQDYPDLDHHAEFSLLK